MSSVSEALRMIWKALKEWWDGWFGMLLFGLVWVLCWFTVLLGPPATFGFFHAVRWWIVEKETRWDQYYRMAKKHLFVSWLWFLANVLVIFLVYINYTFYGNLKNSTGQVLQGISLVAGFIWVATQFYALPYYVLLEKKSLFTAWKNGLFTILASPVFSLVVWVALAILLYIHLAVMPLFFGGPALIITLASVAVEDRIQKFGIRERDAKKDSEQESIQE